MVRATSASNPRSRSGLGRSSSSFELFEGNRDPITHEIIDQARISLDRDVILQEMQAIADLGATVCTVDDLLGTGKYQNDRPDARRRLAARRSTSSGFTGSPRRSCRRPGGISPASAAVA